MHSEGVAGGDRQRSAPRPFVEGSTACGAPSGVKQPHCHQALAGLNWLTDSPPGEVLTDGVVSPATATVPEALTVQWSPPKHVSRIKRSQIYRASAVSDTNWLSQRRLHVRFRVLCRMSFSVHQSQSRPPPTVQIRRKEENRSGPTSSICDTASRWSGSGCCQDRRRRSGLTRQESGRFRACLAPDLSSGLPAPAWFTGWPDQKPVRVATRDSSQMCRLVLHPGRCRPRPFTWRRPRPHVHARRDPGRRHRR